MLIGTLQTKTFMDLEIHAILNIKLITMKTSIKLLLNALVILVTVISCGPPEQYEKGMSYYNTQKYDSAMYYFDRLLPDAEEWLDSAKNMKTLCLERMITGHDWLMYNSQLDIYSRDTSLMAKSNKVLEQELMKMIKNDSLVAFYKVFDTYKSRFNSEIMKNVMHSHIDEFLNKHKWKGTGSLSGQTLYFERDEEGANGKSAKTLNGWNKGLTIYKAIAYDKEGIFSMKPRIYRGGGSYFGKGGSVAFKGKDSLKINYGKALHNTVNYFVRDEEIKPVQ